MHLVQVDVVGAKPAKTAFDRVDEVLARQPNVVGAVACDDKALGPHDKLVPAHSYRPAHDHFRVAGVVSVGGIDEVDPRVERGVDYRNSASIVHVPRAEHVGAQTDPRYLQSAAPESHIFHRIPT